MPWKYSRITRRCTRDRPPSEEEEIHTERRLKGMSRRRCEVVIFCVVRKLHADVISHNITVNTGGVHALAEHVMVDGKACNFFHKIESFQVMVFTVLFYNRTG